MPPWTINCPRLRPFWTDDLAGCNKGWEDLGSKKAEFRRFDDSEDANTAGVNGHDSLNVRPREAPQARDLCALRNVIGHIHGSTRNAIGSKDSRKFHRTRSGHEGMEGSKDRRSGYRQTVL